jgi:hypothetical protein
MIYHHATKSLRETFPVRASEWALSVMIFNWGVVLLLNDNLFSISPSYNTFSSMMPEQAWGLVCLLVGLMRILFLFINGLWRRSPHLRLIGAFAACFFWFQITAGFIYSGTWSTGLAIYPVLLLLDFHNVLRAATDAAIIDRKYSEQRHGINA